MICDCNMIYTGRKIRTPNPKYDCLSSTYKLYIGIRYRCNPNQKDISPLKYRREVKKMSSLWSESYELFLLDMGERPSKYHSVDRIDPNLGYCKHNCRWATAFQQNMNKLSSVNPEFPLGVSAKEGRTFFRLTCNKKEIFLLSGTPLETFLSSYLFQCLEMITKDKEKAVEIYKKMRDNELQDFSKYFDDLSLDL